MYCFRCMKKIPHTGYCEECKCAARERAAHPLKPGTILNNKYFIGDVLGEGGFGITYIGRDLTLDIPVAVKEYYPYGYASRDSEQTTMVTVYTEEQRSFFVKGKASFLEEARKIAMFLDEPGIVSVRDYFDANGTAYIIMEYLAGEDLSTSLKREGAIPAERLFRMMLPLMASLQKMHSAGLIHRDISPSNIMLLPNGTLKLMDFGNARYFLNNEKELSVILKPGYAPEEQYRKDGEQGPWTDVYALCATIYKCVTGEKPEDALDRIRSDKLTPPGELAPISKELEAVLLYGLAVYSEDRCRSMNELAELTKKALDADPVTVPAARHSDARPVRPAAVPQQDRLGKTGRIPAAATAPGDRAAGPIPPAPTGKTSRGLRAAIACTILLLLCSTGLLTFLLLSGRLPRSETTNVSSDADRTAEAAGDRLSGASVAQEQYFALASMTDEDNGVTRYTWGNGVCTRVSPDGTVTTFRLSSDGSTTAKTVNGETVSAAKVSDADREYDADGRLIGKTTHAESPDDETRETYIYDGNGALVRYECFGPANDRAVVIYTYDNGRLVTSQRTDSSPNAPDETALTQYIYDAFGNVVREDWQLSSGRRGSRYYTYTEVDRELYMIYIHSEILKAVNIRLNVYTNQLIDPENG